MSRSKRQGDSGNPARVQAVQELRRSGASGYHRQADERTRAELDREAIEEFYEDEEN